MSAEPWSEHEDERDRIERAAALDSRQRFLRLLGPLRTYLMDPGVKNINVNGGADGRIFVESAEGKFEAPEAMSRADREALITNIATKCGTAIGTSMSRLSADMPHGFDVRVTAFCPPASDWTLMLRTHMVRVVTLDEYVERGWMTAARCAAVRAAVARGDNIGVVGRPGSGKTTFLNALLHESAQVRPLARLALIQDRNELKPSHADCIPILAGIEQARFENGRLHRYIYEFEQALQDALRTDYDLIAVGELRDANSARTLLNALNTGVRGCSSTWHADSALDGLYRLEDLLRSGGFVPPRRMITRFVDMIVFIAMSEDRSERGVGDVVFEIGVDEHDQYCMESVAA
jgi:Flp pilus assembly CpaF family ATPase